MTRCVVVGAGAREHALAWALARRAEVVVTPGSAGIAAHGFACVDTPATELDGDLFVIGPEQPLVDGLADELRAQGKVVVGPGADGARLEGSKSYMKDFLARAGVPTAAYGSFADETGALAFLDSMRPPYVVKTDGLAAGKGVLVTNDVDEARRDVRAKLSGAAFGDAGTTVVIEEGLVGEECSLLFLCSGASAAPLVAAQDFKRVGDHGVGANTGGMGAYAPMASMGPEQVGAVQRLIIDPTLRELHARGIDFRGVLYAGVMLTERGPTLLEYNVRFGDPEAEVLVALYGDTLFDQLLRVGRGQAVQIGGPVSDCAVTVILAAAGYPERPRRGDLIAGLGPNGQLARPLEGVIIFHAGTEQRPDGHFVTAGGRVLAVTAVAPTLDEARRRAYQGASLVTFEGKVMRSDIARDVA